MWKLFTDTGGTFTDCLAVDPAGCESRAKVLSNGCLRFTLAAPAGEKPTLAGTADFPANFFRGCVLSRFGAAQAHVIHAHAESRQGRFKPETDGSIAGWRIGDTIEVRPGLEAPLVGAHLLTQTPFENVLPPMELRLATTRGTNALLEGKGARVAFFVTQGFRDLLRIGDQTRPDLFALDIRCPPPLHAEVFEVSGRLSASGAELEPLDLPAVRREAERLTQAGIEAVCICLLHSDVNPAHEHTVGRLLRDLGMPCVVESSQLSPFVHYGRRAETALVDAYLRPIMECYVEGVTKALGPTSRLRVMSSAGGLLSVSRFHPKDSLLSGPAGGIVGAAAAGRQAGRDHVIAFDMGGTSTDVSRYGGAFSYQQTHRVGQARLQAAALRIETVAAGGGSICWMDQGALHVGPHSAGASPGPACYGFGGPFTLTDVHLLLGRLHEERFSIPIDRQASVDAFQSFLRENDLDSSQGEAYLEGFLQIANERMAQAIRSISFREGADPSAYALLAFGGAGGLHACGLAALLGITEILFPADAGILSARGLQRARLECLRERQVLRPWREAKIDLRRMLEGLADKALGILETDAGRALPEAVTERTLTMRWTGQEGTLLVPLEGHTLEDAEGVFKQRYENLFGHLPDLDVELVSASVRVKTPEESFPLESFKTVYNPLSVNDFTFRRAWINQERRSVPALRSEAIPTHSTIDGPCAVLDAHSSLFVDPGWALTKGDRGTLRLRKSATTETADAVTGHAPEVTLELFTQRFRNVVEVMGDQLKKTALSTNVKERMDYSCCLLDCDGRLVANAPHIPVHLGAMGLCVREVAHHLPLTDGDVVLTNHPGFGGSHLPDLTVILPVFHEGTLVAYVADRAHHAEIGGTRPGSMPPGAVNLEEEGVLIHPVKLFEDGRAQYERIREILTQALYPTRAIEENLADLRAQVSACRTGQGLLRNLLQKFGSSLVMSQMRSIYQQAFEAAREAVARLVPKAVEVEERLDDGSVIRVKLSPNPEALVIDFTGTTAPRHPLNLNATPAIVRSAVMYVLRVLQHRDLPLNEGLLDAVRLVLPECFLNPRFDREPLPAVVGGNVETSQRLVDTLLKAFRVVACSQGTMNNLIFGNARLSYYETIAGGAGAGPGFDGASGVHTHMTNTAITDPEILERRFPVRLHRFALRPDSGGHGASRGGAGIVRELEFLESVQVSLLTEHRREGPYGMEGGAPGRPGAQWILRADGSEEILSSLARADLNPGDRLIIETPGGGGWGPPGQDS